MSSHRDYPVRAVGDEEHAHEGTGETVVAQAVEGELGDEDLDQISGGATGHIGGVNVGLMDGSVR